MMLIPVQKFLLSHCYFVLVSALTLNFYILSRSLKKLSLCLSTNWLASETDIYTEFHYTEGYNLSNHTERIIYSFLYPIFG